MPNSARFSAMPDISAKITELAATCAPGAPEEFTAWMTKAIAEWGDVVKAENIQIEG